MIDELDKRILIELQLNGRVSNAALARRVNLSPPATHVRIKQLEENGYIQKYVAILDRQKVDYDMLCFVRVRLQLHDLDKITGFQEAIQTMPEILECHHLTGEYDYLLKIVALNTEDLEHFLVKRLTPIPGVAQIHTSLVLREVKNTTSFPLD